MTPEYEVHVRIHPGAWLQIWPDPLSLENARLLAATIRDNQKRERCPPVAVWIRPAINPQSNVLH